MKTFLLDARRAPRGFTLLEMGVAVTIFSMIAVIALVLSTKTAQYVGDEILQNDLHNKTETTLKKVAGYLSQSTRLGVSADGTSVTLQVPIDVNGNGSVLDASGVLEFGVQTEDGQTGNGVITFIFVVDRQLSEIALGRDLNGDGDRNDIFDLGFIERTSTLPGDTTQQYGLPNIVQPSGNHGGDITGNGQPDPIFSVVGRRLTVNIWALGQNKEGEGFMARSTTDVFLRNQ